MTARAICGSWWAALHYSKDAVQGRLLAELVKFVRSLAKRQVKRSEPRPKIHKLEQRLAPEVGEELATAYRAGASTADLRRRFGLSQPSVLKLLAGHGVETRHQRFAEEDALSAVALYQEGQTMMQLAEKFGVNIKTIRRALVRHGVTIRPKRHQEPREGA